MRGVHGDVTCILLHHVKVGRDCGNLVVVEAVLRLLCPERLERESVFTSAEYLEERFGIFLPTPEHATKVANLVSRNCGAHHVKP